MKYPDFDSKPLYTDGVRYGWVGYGIFFEWPSASFQIFVWKDDNQISLNMSCIDPSFDALSC